MLGIAVEIPDKPQTLLATFKALSLTVDIHGEFGFAAIAVLRARGPMHEKPTQLHQVKTRFMENYLGLTAAALAIMAFVPAIFFFLRASYQFVQMLGHYRSGKHQLAANLLPFLVPFMPQVFTEQGNLHRQAFLSNLGWSLCCIVFIAVVYAFLGVGHV